MSSREIAVELGIHQSTITRHISSLIKSNELVNLELNKFKPYQLILGDECEHLSGDILPTKEQVEERWTST
jgi:predicted transcriptional regulator